MDFVSDPLCRPLLQKLRVSRVETREFLRPVFKWMKQGGRNYDPERAFSFVEWMISIRDNGDPAAGIAQHSHIQPKYAYNTIITMSQRYDKHDVASRAFNCMIYNGMEPDVFTLTALVDVMGRNGRFEEAMELYRDMLAGKMALPNVVTFVSLIRVAGNLRGRDDAQDIVKCLIDDACLLSRTEAGSQLGGGADGGSIVISIYNAALSAFVRLGALDCLVSVLCRMRADDTEWTSLTFDIVSKYLWRHGKTEGFSTAQEYALHMRSAGAIDDEKVQSLSQYVEEYVQQKDKRNSSSKRIYAGCLGPDAPPAMRSSVIQHDIGKLLDRLEPDDSSQLTENDFVTLLHQCRKRKWADQIAFVLSQMTAVSTEGLPESDIPPQPQLAPTRPTFEAAMDGYFHMMRAEDARALLVEALDMDAELDDDFLFFAVGGFLHCGDARSACETYFLVRERDVLPSVETVRCMLRGLGGAVDKACQVLCDVFDLLRRDLISDRVPPTDTHTDPPTVNVAIAESNLLRTLLQSCVSLGRADCLLEVLNRCLRSSHEALRATAETMTSWRLGAVNVELVQICVMAACSSQDIRFAVTFLSQCQQLGHIPPSLCVFSLALEALGCFVERSCSQAVVSDGMPTLPFRGFLHVGAVKLLETKASLLHHYFDGRLEEESALACESLLVTAFGDSYDRGEGPWGAVVSYFTGTLSDVPEDPVLNHYAMCYQMQRLPVLALAYIQHLYALSVMVRCKIHKEILVQKTATSLQCFLTQEFVADFVLNLLVSLPKLEITNKQQAKLIGVVLTSIADKELSYDGDSGLWRQLSSAMTEVSPCLEVVKEVCRFGRAAGAPDMDVDFVNLLVFYLENRLETPVKIVQVIKQFGLHAVIDLGLLEDLLVAYCVEDTATHWMALTTYISDHGTPGYYEACCRVCRLLCDLDELDLTARLLCRFQVLHEKQFAHVLSPSAELFEGNEPAANGRHTAISLHPVLRMDEGPACILVVDCAISLQRACDELLPLLAPRPDNHCSQNIISLDAEWLPFSRNSGRRTKCSLLQVASRNCAFLFDLMVLEATWTETQGKGGLSPMQRQFADLIGSLLASKTLCKIGYKVDGDFRRLRESFPLSKQYLEVNNVLELSGCWSHAGGLSGLCKKILNKQLDKSMQTSNWESRPLSDSQKNYAALDAYVLLLLYSKKEAKLSLA